MFFFSFNICLVWILVIVVDGLDNHQEEYGWQSMISTKPSTYTCWLSILNNQLVDQVKELWTNTLFPWMKFYAKVLYKQIIIGWAVGLWWVGFLNQNLSLVEVLDPRIILKGLSSLLAMGSAKVVTLLTFLRGPRPWSSLVMSTTTPRMLNHT